MESLARIRAVAGLYEVTSFIKPTELRNLAKEMPVDVQHAVEEFNYYFPAIALEPELYISNNISIPYELFRIADARETASM